MQTTPKTTNSDLPIDININLNNNTKNVIIIIASVITFIASLKFTYGIIKD